MTTKKPQDCASMDDVRVEIDRIDEHLVALIAERFGYVDRAWQLKNNPADATVPWRIQQVIDKVKAQAVKHDLPEDLAETLWRQMIDWFIEYEESKLSNKAE